MDLAAMLNGVLRLAGLSDRLESSLVGDIVTWLLKNKLIYFERSVGKDSFYHRYSDPNQIYID